MFSQQNVVILRKENQLRCCLHSHMHWEGGAVKHVEVKRESVVNMLQMTEGQ